MQGLPQRSFTTHGFHNFEGKKMKQIYVSFKKKYLIFNFLDFGLWILEFGPSKQIFQANPFPCLVHLKCTK